MLVKLLTLQEFRNDSSSRKCIVEPATGELTRWLQQGKILTVYRLHLAEARDFRALHASGTLKRFRLP